MEPETIILITALVVLGTAIVGLFAKIREVHVMVNSQMDEMVNWADQLEDALRAKGIEVPKRVRRDSPD